MAPMEGANWVVRNWVCFHWLTGVALVPVWASWLIMADHGVSQMGVFAIFHLTPPYPTTHPTYPSIKYTNIKKR